ncbi:DUF6415 family natural product biosynthesis protein [Streptomyces sp. TS71-3]|uniref:DUF6415 family natural product biosynthesis protein n=1 Tax=Streptomyces sp. TS71-3 TaxID=2733862 RepID=UPI001BB3D5C2|nr:DUF6415 family natural product biosynthesis protein [Streptomyces sp. TS71-3]
MTQVGARSRHPDPLDIESMRATAGKLSAGDVPFPRFDDLDDWLLLLRGHLTLLVPEVEGMARALPEEHASRVAALTAVANTRVRLAASPGPGLVSATRHARELAEYLDALCDHHTVLTAENATENRT